MDFDREWTQFACDAEVEHFGTGRIAKAHNALRADLLACREAMRGVMEELREEEARWVAAHVPSVAALLRRLADRLERAATP